MGVPLADGVAQAFPQPYDFVEDKAVDAEFTALYETHFMRVYSFVRSQVGSAADGQEVTGRIFFKAYLHWRRAPRGERAAIWLFKIARTTIIDHWRIEGRRESLRVSLDELGSLPDHTLDPEAQYAVRERAALLLQVVNVLDDDSRMLLSLKFAGQRTNREIAGTLKITEAAVSMRLLRALRALREALTKRGLS